MQSECNICMTDEPERVVDAGRESNHPNCAIEMVGQCSRA